MGIHDDVTAFQFDMAVMVKGIEHESEQYKKHERGSGLGKLHERIEKKEIELVESIEGF